jgi:hypothetical protein
MSTEAEALALFHCWADNRRWHSSVAAFYARYVAALRDWEQQRQHQAARYSPLLQIINREPDAACASDGDAAQDRASREGLRYCLCGANPRGSQNERRAAMPISCSGA